jgi:hypothetical protein
MPNTSSSLLVRAGTDEAARHELTLLYQQPVFAFFCAILQRSPDPGLDTMDWTQGFLVHFFLEAEMRFACYLATAPPRDSFRSYVRTAARNFVNDHVDHLKAVKRGGGLRKLSLSADLGKYEALLIDRPLLTPEQRFEFTFIADRLARAVEAALAERTARRTPLDVALEPYLDSDHPPFARLAKKHGTKPDTVRLRWSALRADRELLPYLELGGDMSPPYQELVRRQIGPSVAALQVRFHRLREDVVQKLADILANELDVADPQRSAEEVTKLLGVMKRLRENQDDM